MDSQLKKKMPSLEFNGVYKQHTILNDFQPHEMQWSLAESSKEQNLAFRIEESERRQIERVNAVAAELTTYMNLAKKQMATKASPVEADVKELLRSQK